MFELILFHTLALIAGQRFCSEVIIHFQVDRATVRSVYFSVGKLASLCHKQANSLLVPALVAQKQAQFSAIFWYDKIQKNPQKYSLLGNFQSINTTFSQLCI